MNELYDYGGLAASEVGSPESFRQYLLSYGDYLAAFEKQLTVYLGKGRFCRETAITTLFSPHFAGWIKRKKQKSYYKANCLAFLVTARNIVNASPEGGGAGNWLQAHYRKKLLDVLWQDSLLLWNDYYENVLSLPPPHELVPVGSGADKSFCTVVGGLLGDFDGLFGWTDREVSASAAVLRVFLELRLKSGLGLLGLHDNSAQSIVPLPVNIIFKLVEEYIARDLIRIAPAFSQVLTIYRWTNLCVHSGIRFYRWYPLVAVEYLRPLADGIICSTDTVRKFQSELEGIINKDYGARRYELIKHKRAGCQEWQRGLEIAGEY